MISIAILWVAVPLAFRLEAAKRWDPFFRYSLAALLVGQYLVWFFWEIATGRFTVQLSLPLNLCDLSIFLCAFLLVARSYKIYEVVYFWALAGTIQSYITPNIYFAYPHLEFFAFYIQHGGEILAILYVTFVTGFRPQAISIAKSYGVLVAYLALVYLFNLAFGSNYMFLMADTPQPSTITKMIRVFGAPPMHIIGLGLVASASYLLLYAPFAVKDLVHKKKKDGRNAG